MLSDGSSSPPSHSESSIGQPATEKYTTPPSSPPRTPTLPPSSLPSSLPSSHSASTPTPTPTPRFNTILAPSPSAGAAAPVAAPAGNAPPVVTSTKKRTARTPTSGGGPGVAGRDRDPLTLREGTGNYIYKIKTRYNEREQRFNLRFGGGGGGSSSTTAGGNAASAVSLGKGKDRERLDVRESTGNFHHSRHGARPGTAESQRSSGGEGSRVGKTSKSESGTRDGQDADDDDAYILVMGASGTGKTSFINLASDSNMPVSSGLKSCTTEVAISERFTVDGERVRLVDTPGFDDAARSDAEVLNIVAGFLTKELFARGKRVRSILYLHRISDVRMGAVAQRHMRLFQQLIGQHAFGNVVIVTTRWNEVNGLVAESREAELRDRAAFFRPLVDAGAPMERYARTRECTERIVRCALQRGPVQPPVGTVVDGGVKSEQMEGIERCAAALKGLVREIGDGSRLDGLGQLEADIRELRERLGELQESSNESWEIIEQEAIISEEDSEDPIMIGGLSETETDSTWMSWLVSLFGL